MKLSSEQIAVRKPVWWAMSELWLDTEHSEEWLLKLAAIIRTAGFSPEQAHEIFIKEIAPVFYINALAPAGEWKGWSEDGVEERITRYLRSFVASQYFNLLMSKVGRPELMWQRFSRAMREDAKGVCATPGSAASIL